jgi:hypothetical protein
LLLCSATPYQHCTTPPAGSSFAQEFRDWEPMPSTACGATGCGCFGGNQGCYTACGVWSQLYDGWMIRGQSTQGLPLGSRFQTWPAPFALQHRKPATLNAKVRWGDESSRCRAIGFATREGSCRFVLEYHWHTVLGAAAVQGNTKHVGLVVTATVV